MIGVDVRAQDGFDPHPAITSDFDVLSDLELRIDDRSAALTASTEDVRRAAGFGSKELSEDHDQTP
jgi:hypothetical protein